MKCRFPTSWQREYRFKPGEKVQVRNSESDKWVYRYFLKKEYNGVYPWVATVSPDVSNIACGWRYIKKKKLKER